MKKFTLALLLSAAIVSCRIADFTMISTKNVEFEKKATLLQSGVSGRGFDLKTATDHAIESVPGGVFLENVVIYDTGLRYKVKGDVWGYK